MMQNKTQLIIIGFVMIAFILVGMYLQKEIPIFSVTTSSRTCDSWKANAGIPASTQVPFNWAYTTSQIRCVTALTPSGTGCSITYEPGACTISPPVCTPSCTNKQCGDNGCGGSCGTCPTGKTCSNYQCITIPPVCTPSCTNKQCGDNGCGGSCGTCPTGKVCSSAGQCINEPSQVCTSGQKRCVNNTTDKYQTCLSSGSWSGIQTCNQGYVCSNGNCVTEQPPISQCTIVGDTNCDKKISREELTSATNKWLGGQMSRNDLGIAIQTWANG